MQVPEYNGSKRVVPADPWATQPNTRQARRPNAFAVVPPPHVYREERIDPLEGPDSRWRQAEQLVKVLGGSKAAKRAHIVVDGVVEERLVPFAREVAAVEANEGPDAADRRWPGLYWAYVQHIGRNSNHHAGVVDLLEAYLMTGLPREAIANEMLLHPEHVHWYEQAFFDVRAFLDYPTWIAAHVIVPRIQAVATLRTSDVLWKMVAWKMACGVQGLRAVSSFTGEYTDNVKQQVNGVIRNKLIDSALTATAVRTPNQYNSSEILEQYHQVVLSIQDTGASAESEQCIMEMLHEVQTMIAPATVAQTLPATELSRIARAFTDREPKSVEGVVV